MKKRISRWINQARLVYERFYRIGISGPRPDDRIFLFFFLSWSFLFLFLVSFLLAGKNPYALLFPSGYDAAWGSDPRQLIEVYGADGDNNIVPVKRSVLLEKDDFRHNVYTLIGEVGSPVFFASDTVDSGLDFQNLERLLNLQMATNILWKRGSECIWDLRMSTIEEILKNQKFRIDYTYQTGLSETEKRELLQKRKLNVLANTLKSVERTLFANFSDLNSISYRIDGNVRQIEGLEYDMTVPHFRSETK